MSEEQLDLFARGELTPAESRDLAQRALDDSDLFDDLTAMSLARSPLQRRRTRSPRISWMVAAAAAVLVLAVGFYTLRRPSHLAPQIAAVSSQPILLSQNTASTTFRAAEPEARAARASGSVIQVGDGAVTIDLGSLDGLAKGSEVELVRDGQAIGKLTLITIFRDHARGSASAGISVHVKDSIRVPQQIVVRAALDQIDALVARGDIESALRIAQQAPGGDPTSISPVDLNNLGVIAELHGDRIKAQMFYERALRQNPPEPTRQSIEANLARIKSLK